MNYSFKIELFKSGIKSNIYAIRIVSNELNEVSKFYLNFEKDYKAELDIIFTAISQIADKRGISEDFFRHEGAVFALPKSKCKLRLYCLILSEKILLLYKGGLKPKNIRTYQEAPELLSMVNELSSIHKMIKNKIEDRELEPDNKILKGNTDFTIH